MCGRAGRLRDPERRRRYADRREPWIRRDSVPGQVSASRSRPRPRPKALLAVSYPRHHSKKDASPIGGRTPAIAALYWRERRAVCGPSTARTARRSRYLRVFSRRMRRAPHGEEPGSRHRAHQHPTVWRFFTSNGGGHVDPASRRSTRRTHVSTRRPFSRCPSRATAIHLLERRDPDVFRFQIGQKTFDRTKVDEFLRVAYRDNRLRLVRRSTVVLDHRLHHRGQLV